MRHKRLELLVAAGWKTEDNDTHRLCRFDIHPFRAHRSPVHYVRRVDLQILDRTEFIGNIRCRNNVVVSYLPSTQILCIHYQLFLHVVKENEVFPILVMSTIRTIIWRLNWFWRWRSWIESDRKVFHSGPICSLLLEMGSQMRQFSANVNEFYKSQRQVENANRSLERFIYALSTSQSILTSNTEQPAVSIGVRLRT